MTLHLYQLEASLLLIIVLSLKGEYDLKHIPDHSLLCWSFDSQNYISRNNQPSVNSDKCTVNIINVKYDTLNIPSDWMSDTKTVSALNQYI